MDAASLLLAVSLALLALGFLARPFPALAGPGGAIPCAVLCAVGAATALVSALLSPGPAAAGLVAVLDPLSRPLLLAVFLLGAAGCHGPVLLGTTALALLASGTPALLAALAACAAAALLTRAPPSQDARPRPTALPGLSFLAGRAPGLPALAVLAILLLAAALLLRGGLAPVFADTRGQSQEGAWATAFLLATLCGAAGLAVVLPAGIGGALVLYVLLRLLLDLPGPVTPTWWGAPVLLGGAAAALRGAARIHAAPGLAAAASGSGTVATGVATAGLGAALLARGADLVPAASLAVSATLGCVLAWSAWGALLHLCARALPPGTGARTPGTVLPLAIALLSLAAMPVSAGFAGTWPVLQSVFAAARSGNEATLLACAAAAALLGLSLALAAAAATRLASPHHAIPHPTDAGLAGPPPRLLLAAYAALSAAAGLLPGPLLRLAQPAATALSGALPEGVGVLAVSTATDLPGYAPLALAAGLALAACAAAFAIGPVTRGTPAPWAGGFTGPLPPPGPGPVAPGIRLPRAAPARAALLAIAATLCFAAGWAAR